MSTNRFIQSNQHIRLHLMLRALECRVCIESSRKPLKELMKFVELDQRSFVMLLFRRKTGQFNRIFQPLLAETLRVVEQKIQDQIAQFVDADRVFCQLATNTPCRGSQYQEWHRHTHSLFRKCEEETSQHRMNWLFIFLLLIVI